LSPSECRLLLVDDEPANLDLLEAFLEPDGYSLMTRVTDARQAAAQFVQQQPDIVLLDLHMPFRSGFDILHDLQQLTDPSDFVPVIVLTADATSAARLRALGGGAHDFLTKPLDGVEVRLRVRNMLRTRLLHREQRAAREKAEAARAAREFVLSVVAHDLRNPVASLAMDAELVREMLPEETHARERRTLERVERTAQRMHGLIEDLLMVSRDGPAGLPLQRCAVAVAECLGEAEAMLQPLARGRGITLTFAGDGVNTPIDADPARVVQVVSNLVGNALKFTDAGGNVRVSWRGEEDGLHVTVRDDGAGIPPEHLPHVFGAFWQGDPTAGRGVGLGLVIVRAIVESHGGRIDVESTPGRGTAVHFTLPWALRAETVLSSA
jgi:two-component system, sensor histidine kinase and response regulator